MADEGFGLHSPSTKVFLQNRARGWLPVLRCRISCSFSAYPVSAWVLHFWLGYGTALPDAA